MDQERTTPMCTAAKTRIAKRKIVESNSVKRANEGQNLTVNHGRIEELRFADDRRIGSTRWPCDDDRDRSRSMSSNVTEQEGTCHDGPNTMTADLSKLMPRMNLH